MHRSQLLYNRTRLLSALGRHDEAYAAYTKLIELDPHYTDYLSERAKIARRRGDLARPPCGTTTAPSRPDRHSPSCIHNRGSAYVELGRVSEALDDFNLVLDMEPDDTESLLSRAELLFNSGDLTGARTDIDRCLRLLPEDPRMLCLRGMIHLESEEAAAALLDFDHALAADPGLLAALVNRAVACFQTGQASRAADDLTSALELSGADPDLLLNRAIAYQACADTTLALADIDQALTLPDADITALSFQREACLLKLESSEISALR